MVSPGTHVCCGPGWPLGSCCPRGTPPPPPAQLHRSRSQESRVLGEKGDLGSAAAAGVPPRAAAPGEVLVRGRSPPSVTHLRLALGAPPLRPAAAPGACTALLPSQSETRARVWRGRSLFEGKNRDQGRGATDLGTPQPLTCTAPAHQKLVPPTAALRRDRGAQEPAGRSTGAPFGFSDTPPKTATTKSMGCVGCHRVGCRALTPMRMPRGER